MGVTEVPCRLCFSREYRPIDREEQMGCLYRIVKCLKCGLVYIKDEYDPVSPEYTAITDADISQDLVWLQGAHKTQAFKQCASLLAKSFSGSMRSGLSGNLLDVGCGTGGWLSYISKHSSFHLYGYDPSSGQAEYARRSYPAVRQASSLKEYSIQIPPPFPEFDAITLWDVLEHVRRPRELVSEMAAHLGSGGLIFVSVPAALPQIIKSRLLQVGWPRHRFSWNPREHVSYFSIRTLKELFAKSGLKIISAGTVVAYPRPISAFEFLRRISFRFLSLYPPLSPQIFILASKSEIRNFVRV